MTVIRKYLHTCACATYGSCSYYLGAVFISLRASDCAATFDGSDYLKKYGKSRLIEMECLTGY